MQSAEKNSAAELRHYCMRLETVLLQTRKKESEIQSDYDFVSKQYQKESAKCEDFEKVIDKLKSSLKKLVDKQTELCQDCL